MNGFKMMVCALLLTGSIQVYSQQSAAPQRELVAPAVDFFVPHWYVSLQGGGAYDVGEAKFVDLLSPAVQLTVGYEFNEYIGARLGASGLWARNSYAYPREDYKWNFVQPALDVKANLSNIFFGRNIERIVDVYAFLGGGVAYSFNNDDAERANQRLDVDFQKLWRDNRWNPVVRGGLGIDVMLTKRIKFNLEGNTNMLPDHFNSKKGRSDNKDWVSNVLVGLKIALGPTTRSVAPAVAPVVQEVVEEPKVEVAPAKVVEPAPVVQQPVKREPMRVEVFFDINKTVIRASETGKLQDLVAFLKKYPTDLVSLTGYADRDTGTSQINRRLSVGRAAAVKKYLMDNGIAESRIMSDAKGDTVQPNNTPASNRVVICITETK